MKNNLLETGIRLIDANNLLDFFNALEEAGAEYILFEDVRKFINEQPTRFDYNKIIKDMCDLREEWNLLIYIIRGVIRNENHKCRI